jgi:4-hydroxy-2-oxoglutarate aldolase
MHSSKAPINLAGIFPPIPTPFDEQELVTLERLGENLERWEREPVSGFVVGGSNGEFVSLDAGERLEVLGFVCDQVGGGKLIIAGSGLHATRETVLQTAAMAERGADAALVITPSYYKSRMDDRALLAHFHRVADESPIPIILYNVPANTGIDMSADTIVPLSEHPNIIGLKDSSGNVAKIAEVVLRSPQDFQVLAGSASFLLGALAVGAVGTISALANIAPGALAELMQAFHSGDRARASTLQQKLVRPNTAVTARFGVAGLKQALDLLGYYGGPTRSPLQPLDADQKSELRQTLAVADLLPSG